MFFQLEQRQSNLIVDDSYAELTNITQNDTQVYKFWYKIIDQNVARKEKTLKVRVSVVTNELKIKKNVSSNDEIIDALLVDVSSAKNVAKEQQFNVIANRISDVTAYLSKRPVDYISSMLLPKQVATLKQNNDEQPILQLIATSAQELTSGTLNLNVRETLQKLLFKGIDPTTVVNVNEGNLNAINLFDGTRLASQRTDDDVLKLSSYYTDNKIIEKTTSKIDDEQYVNVVEQIRDNSLTIPIYVTIPRIDGQSGILTVKFELLDSLGLVRESVVKVLDTQQFKQTFLTPKISPLVKASIGDNGRTNLTITQQDEKANAVNIYKKKLSTVSVDVDDYSLIGTFDLENKQSIIVPVDVADSTISIYRVIAIGRTGILGFDFTNLVVTKAREFKHLSIVSRLTLSGVELTISNLPASAKSILVKSKNLSINEKKYRLVEQVLITEQDETIIVNDSLVSLNDTYEYAVDIIDKFGKSKTVVGPSVEVYQLNPGKVNLNISNIVSGIDSNDEINVTFDVSSTIIDKNIDVILSLLRKQEIINFFEDDVAKERTFLKSLIAHNIQRVDLLTGEKEDFGVITTSTFNDVELRNNVITPLKTGRKYRYEIETLIRSPETMFEKYRKEETDQVTGKSYTFSPSKFLHPITLSEGTLASTEGLRMLYAKDEMIYGRTGVISTIDVSFDDYRPSIVDPNVEVFSKYHVITWEIDGDITKFDHFLIIRSIMNVRTIIGKVHCEFFGNSCFYVHNLSEQDIGEIRYVIQPIFNDYYLGKSLSTHSVIVKQ